MDSEISRRTILGSAAVLAATSCVDKLPRRTVRDQKPDIALNIAPIRQEIAPGIEYATFAYNGTVPGPILRMQKGRKTIVEVENLLATPEIVHWHGLQIPSDVDGAEEEGTPPVDRFRKRQYSFAPGPGGAHWYHTHMIGAKALMFGAYSGLFGFNMIDGDETGSYDQEIFIAMHHWGPRWEDNEKLPRDHLEQGREVVYDYGTMNGRLYGHHDPIRVHQGQRVLFHVLNASATEITWTALAGHQMKVIGLDGYPVAKAADIDVLMLGPGERADVLVEMNNPGKWKFGAAKKREREAGMAMLVEYAGAKGEAMWTNPNIGWDFKRFANDGSCAEPDKRFELRLGRIAGGPGGYNSWTINDKIWPNTERLILEKGKRYRLAFVNDTEHGHPMHLHRHHFELASYDGIPCKGVFKDTLNIRPNTTTEVDFIADNPGPTLLHCHQAAHQDFGLMSLLLYKGDSEPHFDPGATMAAIDQVYCS